MLWWNRTREADLDRELQAHLDLEAEERGGDRYAARRALGNTTLIKEDTRAQWAWAWLDRLAQDLRYAARALRMSPGFTTVAVLSLALGMGASTAIFSVVNGVLLRPLPYPESARLVRLWEELPRRAITRNVVNGWNFLDWRERSRSFEAIAAIQELGMNITGRGEPIALQGVQASPGFFEILRVPPLLGRTFARSGEVVLSYGLWQASFAGNPAIIGQSIVVNGAPAAVVGVMPPGFSFGSPRFQLWMPLIVERSQAWRRGRALTALARLKPGVTLEQARADLTDVARQYARERPDFNQDWTANVIPLLEDTTRNVRLALLVLLGAVGVLLLIACANVANLFLMRGAERAREVALRETLGASKWRIFRQYLTESLLVALLAAGAGITAGHFGLRAMLALLPAGASLPRTEAIGLDARVFAFALAASVLTAILFGLVPLLHTRQPGLQKSLRFRSRTASKGLRRVFVTAQVGLALVLLAGAGLMTRSFTRLISVDPGFATERLLALSIFASPARFNDGRVRAAYFERILAELRAAPGVAAASSVHFLPLENIMSRSCFGKAGEPRPTTASPSADFWVVGSGYFATMGIPLAQGRDIAERDQFGTPSVVVVNRALAQRYYPREDPLGKRLNICWGDPDTVAEIVGVAEDARQHELRSAPQPAIFVANSQWPNFFATFVIRAREDPSQIAQAAIAAVHRVNPDQAVPPVRTMETVLNASVARPRFQFVLLLIFAGVALLLAAVGVYGVASYSVAQRTQEIGVRAAVGATRRAIAGLVLKEGLLLSAVGIVVGLAGALATTRFLATLLYEITPTDPLTLSAVCGLLVAITAAALAVPLRRATRIDPVVALRYE